MEIPNSLVGIATSYLDAYDKLTTAQSGNDIRAAASRIGGMNGHIELAGPNALREQLLAELSRWILEQVKESKR